MTTEPLPTLLLSGFMGTGKSTVGRLVAARAGAAFLDLDHAVATAAGKAVDAIFRDDGEAAFRALEATELARALDLPGPRVVALGGGALLDPGSRRTALTRGRVVTLMATADTLIARLAGSGTTRPLLDSEGDRLVRVRELLAARAATYAESHAVVRTDGLSPDEVAAAVLRAWSDAAIAVRLGARSYAVRVTGDGPAALADVLRALAPSSTFLVTDENVARVSGLGAALPGLGVKVAATVTLTPGEEQKRLAAVEHALSVMVTGGADRDAVVVAHGGGVVSDIAGFAAATLLRGVRWVVVPTTLLAMVDAAVGGKTGVDLGLAKNAVGAFHQPSAVVIAPGHVATESARAYVSGLAEVVKTAAIGDPALFELLEREAPRVVAREPEVVGELVRHAVAVKAGVVSRDERESGERAILNFGHTVGHALEAAGGYVRFTHGEAVALGMVAALRAGVALGVTPAGVARRTTRLLEALGLPVALDPGLLREAFPLVALDKKRQGGEIKLVLVQDVGSPVVRRVPMESLAAVLDLR